MEARPLPDFPGYAVTAEGIVLGKRGASLRPYRGGHYDTIALWRDGKRITKRIHNLVANVWLPPQPSSEHEVAHWDGDARNNTALNLRWATHAENCADTVRHGRSTQGERHPNRKLDDAKIRAMRASRVGGATFAEIASAFGISRMAAWRAVTGAYWAHVA